MKSAINAVVLSLVAMISVPVFAAEPVVITIDTPQVSGISGFRAHWDMVIPVAENGERLLKDNVVKDRGQTAVWNGVKAGPLAFDAVHRNLLVRFPDAAKKIADTIAEGNVIDKIELVLPYFDEEIWPQGSGPDYPSADGYRYRPNWDCDRLYREQRPNWHAIAYPLRKPWQVDAVNGPTYNAAIKDAVYWKKFGASDTTEDRFPTQFGPTEVSSYKPEGRMDITSLLTDTVYGKTLAERLRLLADCGFIVSKQEVYDARYFQGAYEWAISTGPRAILIKNPNLVVTFKPGKAEKLILPEAADIKAITEKFKEKPSGKATATVPSAEEVIKLNDKFMAKPTWMPEWQYKHIQDLMSLESAGKVQPFYYRAVPQHVINRAIEVANREAKKKDEKPDLDYAVYLSWLDWVNGRPPRFWEGHLTGADNATQWYSYREAMPGPVQESILRSWNAWLMPDKETQLNPTLRRTYDDISGKLVHPMVDDPRVGRSKDGKQAEWNQGDTYYKLTGDWRGNKSYYRSGFTREMSTANFNSSASGGALLNGQIIGSENAMADGRAGLMQFPFWMWTYNSGVGQEYIDHYYWAIATSGNKLFPDFCEKPEDKMAGQSILFKTVNDLSNGYHPNLKKLMGPASRTYFEHVLGQQDGLYHILHVISPKGALSDMDTHNLPELGTTTWGHDYPAASVALQSLSGPWSEPWFVEMLDEKPLPWSSMVEKKVVADGDCVCTYFGVNYGLTSIRFSPQRIHMLGHWRRKAERPTSMHDIGTLDMRVGFNQTQIGDDGAGVITEQGKYRTYQHGNKLIMIAKPQSGVIAQQGAAHQFGQKSLPAQEIKSVQCTAALFNYEKQAATWSVFIDDKKVEALPATAKYGQIITIQDGVSYVAIRPLSTDDLGRDIEIGLEAGKPQNQAYHESTNIQPALLINAYLYKKDVAISADILKKLDSAQTGFVVEMGDVDEYGSFDKFQAHIREAKLDSSKDGVSYITGKDNLSAKWDGFTVNGTDPYATMKASSLWQDTPVSQMGRKKMEKNGAVVERGTRHPELNMFLHAFPKKNLFIATNPLPNYIDYSFTEPGGVKIVADGACSMGSWLVKDSKIIDIKYYPFTGVYRPDDEKIPATVLFISGAKVKPQVTLNAKDVTTMLKPWKQNGVDGWLVSLTGKFLPDEEIKARLK